MNPPAARPIPRRTMLVQALGAAAALALPPARATAEPPAWAGAPALGTWQAIYLIEHRARPHRREIVLQFIGAAAS